MVTPWVLSGYGQFFSVERPEVLSDRTMQAFTAVIRSNDALATGGGGGGGGNPLLTKGPSGFRPLEFYAKVCVIFDLP